MRKTLVLSAGAAALIALSWLRLEEPRESGGRLLVVLALALVPALPARRARRLAVIPVALLPAAAVAFDVSPLHVVRLFDHAEDGLRSFYDVSLPFDPAQRPEMHGLVLLGIFAFALGISLSVRERRSIAASVVLAAGAGWPATLRPGDDDLARGAFILAGALVLLAALRSRPLTRRGPALAAGVVVVLAGVLASSYSAVARDGFVNWQTWDPYARNDPSVGVDYVWESNYDGIEFPVRPTKLLEIAAPPKPRYWRATALDLYRKGRWLESLALTAALPAEGRVELTSDLDFPSPGRLESGWLEQQVRVAGLRDTHLVGASIPTAYAVDADKNVRYRAGGIAEVDGGLRRGLRYTVWSHSPSPSPSRLARAGARYAPEISASQFEVERGAQVPPFGTPGRHRLVLDLIRSDPRLSQYESLYAIARRVGGARTPYGAVVAVETWLRSSPQFRYEEQPPRPLAGVPPLVDFVTRTRSGYCQHYAGAMALMLRYLGIPARVAAGFTSGRYDREQGTWTVTDRNAHTWVEVWFRGFGWLPFDPTPGRGNLSGGYTSSSLGFRGREALAAFGRNPRGLGVDGRRALERQVSELLARERAREGKVQAVPPPDSDDDRGGAVLSVLLLVTLAGGATIAATKLTRRRLRYLRADPRRRASACRRELVDFMRDQRVEIRPGATLAELGETLRTRLAVHPGRFVTAAGVARFGPAGVAEGASRTARRELGELKRQLRGALSGRRRLRGLVSVRSLRE